MDFKDIHRLVKLITKEQLAEFKMKDGDFELSIRTINYVKSAKAPIVAPSFVEEPIGLSRDVAPPASPNPTAPEQSHKAEVEESSSSEFVEIKSPIVGTFYRSASPEKPPYVKVGDSVESGAVVCIVEAMKLFNEIESEVSGKIVKVMVEDGQPVQYDQVLFLVEPNA